MRTTTILAVGLTAALMLAVVMSFPAAAQPSGPDSSMILLVKGGHGGFHGGLGFYGGFYGPYRYGSGYGPYYGGDGYGYYTEGNNTCVWNGYNYRCYNTNKDFY